MSNPITGKQSAGDPLVFASIDEAKKHYEGYVTKEDYDSFEDWVEKEQVSIVEVEDDRADIREASEGRY